MRNIILSIVLAFLIFGCIGVGTQEQTEELPGVDDLLEPQDGAAPCNASYSFSDLEDSVFSEKSYLLATVVCAAGEKLELSVGDEVAESFVIANNESTVVTFTVPTTKNGIFNVTVTSDGNPVFFQEWEVEPLGNTDTTDVGYDGISFKEWRAMAFDIETPVELGRVRIFMKRIEGKTQPNTNILVEVREDDGENPGELLDVVTLPITETTLSDNWINFDFDPKVQLEEGKYWIVMKVEQTEDTMLVSDTVMIHYVTVDKEVEGNDYTRLMRLSVDDETGYASETEWEWLPYDKIYNVVLRYE